MCPYLSVLKNVTPADTGEWAGGSRGEEMSPWEAMARGGGQA